MFVFPVRFFGSDLYKILALGFDAMTLKIEGSKIS